VVPLQTRYAGLRLEFCIAKLQEVSPGALRGFTPVEGVGQDRRAWPEGETSPFSLVKKVNIRHYGVMIMKKRAVTLLSALILFSCGELPEMKPIDWDSRLSFSKTPYTDTELLFEEWDEVVPDVMEALDSEYAQDISKSRRWKGSGKLKLGQQPVYYILRTKSDVTVTIDWRYRGDERIGFVFKRVGAESGDYGFDVAHIAMKKDDYLVIRISLPTDGIDISDTGWELGFTVK
jgi:hypothetical protein